MRLSHLPCLALVVAAAACGGDDRRTPTSAADDVGALPVDPEPAAAPATTADAALVARGDYLVNAVMNCGGCHTPMGPDGAPDPARHLAGGLEIPEPWGTWRSRNITPDRKTGIGDWTDAEIAAAIREGRRPSGDRLYAIMPSAFYHQMSDDDVRAVVAYLRSIPAVEHAVAGNTDLRIPRADLPPAPGRAPGATDVERGAYLGSLMVCGHCHTPMDATGAPDLDRAMAGGMEFHVPPFVGTGAVYAANLTPDVATGLGGWTDAEVWRAITKLTKRDGSPVVGPMALLGASWHRMTAEDVAAVIAWLRALPPVEHRVPAATFVPASS